MILNCSSCGASFKVDTALLGTNGRSVRCGSCGHSWHQMPPDDDLKPEFGAQDIAEEQVDIEIEEVAKEAPEPEIDEITEEDLEPEIEEVAEEAPEPEPEVEAFAEDDDELEIEDVADTGVAARFEDDDTDEQDVEPRIAAVSRPDPTLDKLDQQRKRVQARSSVVVSERRSPSQVIGWIALLLLLAVLAGVLWVGKSQIIAWAPGTVRFYEMAGLHAGVGQGLDLRDVISDRRVVEGERRLVVEGTVVNISENLLRVPQIKASLTDGEGAELAQWVFAADSETLPPGGFTTFQTSTANPPDEGNLSLAFIEGDQIE